MRSKSDNVCVMHSKSDIIEIMIYDKADEVRKNVLNHFLLDIKQP